MGRGNGSKNNNNNKTMMMMNGGDSLHCINPTPPLLQLQPTTLSRTNLLTSSSFSEACKLEGSAHALLEGMKQSAIKQAPPPSTTTTTTTRRSTVSIDAIAVSLASMRQDHKDDPPLPTDVLRRIFEPIKATTTTTVTKATANATTTTAETFVPATTATTESAITSFVLKSSTLVLPNGTTTTKENKNEEKTSLLPTPLPAAVTSDLEFSTALNMLAMCQKATKEKGEIAPTLSHQDVLPPVAVPISPSYSQHSDLLQTKHPPNRNDDDDYYYGDHRPHINQPNHKRKKPSNHKPSQRKQRGIKRSRIRLPIRTPHPSQVHLQEHRKQIKPPMDGTASIPAHPVGCTTTQPIIVVRTGVDPQDGSPTVVRKDGGVLREYKQHTLPLSSSSQRTLNDLDSKTNNIINNKAKTLHDEILPDGLLLPTQEDLNSYPTERQKKAFRTFIHRVNELRQYIQHYGDGTFCEFVCTCVCLSVCLCGWPFVDLCVRVCVGKRNCCCC
jgi:hypothetical protein